MADARRTRRLLVRVWWTIVVLVLVAGTVVAAAYWAAARRFVVADAHALDGIVGAPVEEPVAFGHVAVWDGRGGPVQHDRSVVIRDGRIAEILDAAVWLPGDVRPIDGSGKTLIPGLIDAHVHLMFDSGPDLLRRAPQLLDAWLATTRRYPESRAPIMRRGQLKLKAGVTTMRVLGDGYYSLAYRDDVAKWEIVGPRVLTAGLHVNGPNGYVSGGLGAHLSGAARAEVAVELHSFDDIEPRLREHIARGVDVIKIATTYGDLGFQDAKPDLPEAWVREIVRIAHSKGLKVTAHSYGTEGDGAAVRGGVDGIEHLVNVPHDLPADLVQAIKARGIYVCPTLSGSAYSVWTSLQAPERLYRDRDLLTNVPADVRKDLGPELEGTISDLLGKGQEPWLEFVVDQASHSPILFFRYPTSQPAGFEYLKRTVKLEFGSLSEQRPTERHPIRPWIADVPPDTFTDWQCSVVALDVQRTFWEKATILHTEYHRPADKATPDRYSRHYADTAALSLHPAGSPAISQDDLRHRVVDWKSRFFSSGWARYDLAQPPTFNLVPPAEREKALRRDYEAMRDMYLTEPVSFDQIITTLATVERQINSHRRPG